MSRTHKKPYTKSKAVDKTCRCHGSCPWCRGNRLAKHMRKLGYKRRWKSHLKKVS